MFNYTGLNSITFDKISINRVEHCRDELSKSEPFEPFDYLNNPNLNI